MNRCSNNYIKRMRHLSCENSWIIYVSNGWSRPLFLLRRGASTASPSAPIMMSRVGIIGLNRANHAVKPNFYVLIQILHDEALDVEHTCEFLRSGVVMRRQRRQYAEVHRKIMDAWEQFATGHMTAHRLMRTCGRLSIPRIGQAATD